MNSRNLFSGTILGAFFGRRECFLFSFFIRAKPDYKFLCVSALCHYEMSSLVAEASF